MERIASVVYLDIFFSLSFCEITESSSYACHNAAHPVRRVTG
jgi:hypothetical protein